MLTQEHLKEASDDLKEYIGERVGRVEARLDALNGSVSRHERELARHDAQIQVQLGRNSGSTRHLTDADRPAVTKQDIKMVFGVLAVLLTLVEAFHQVAGIATTYLRGLH